MYHVSAIFLQTSYKILSMYLFRYKHQTFTTSSRVNTMEQIMTNPRLSIHENIDYIKISLVLGFITITKTLANVQMPKISSIQKQKTLKKTPMTQLVVNSMHFLLSFNIKMNILNIFRKKKSSTSR